jgi:hypothetical protein
LRGKIERILPSVDPKDPRAVFEVHCTIDSANGTNQSPSLKPGMTLLTRFRLARRSAVDIILKDVKEKDQIPT